MYAVIRRFQSENKESSKVMAICTSREVAWKAKRILHHQKLGSNTDFRIKSILLDTLYPLSVTNNRTILVVDLANKELNKFPLQTEEIEEGSF